MKHIISLGAGVQSSTMALMAAAGEITPMPDCAIFADTEGEPRAVYEWLDWLERQLPFPVHRVSQGDLAGLIGVKPNGKFDYMPLPAFVAGGDGRASLLNRSCTRDYKIIPIRRKVRELVGLTGKRSPKEPIVIQWIGISIDEIQRAKVGREPWMKHRWPLIERGFARRHCLDWMSQRGYPTPPRSACTYCPFHSDAEWTTIKNDPAAWAQAVEVDERIRGLRAGQMTAPAVFLHRSLKPLREVDFEAADDGQSELFDEQGFAIECEGMCGV